MPNPPGWCWIELGRVARLESGHTPSRKFASYWNGGIPWIGIKDARNHHGRRIFKTIQTVSQQGLDNSAARLLPTGTVCLSRTASVGYALVMGEPMATSQDFVNWVCSHAVEPEFLMYLLIAEKESLLRFGEGTTHTTIYYPEVKAFHVCLPAPTEQRAIVSSIESYFTRLDDAVATLERVQRNLKRYRASVLKAAVEGRLVPTEAELARSEGRDYEPAPVLLERILAERRRRWEDAELAKMTAKGKAPRDDKWKETYREPVGPDTTDLPELPEGWCWTTADQVCSSVRDGTHDTPSYVDHGVPLVTSKHLLPNRIDISSARHISTEDHADISRRSGVEVGDVLFAMIGTIGNPVVVRSSTEFSIKNLGLFKANHKFLSSDYLRCWLASQPLQDWLKPRLRGTTQRFASLTLLRSLPTALPPLAEQGRLVRDVAATESLIDHQEGTVDSSRAHLRRLSQSVLKWAFEGRLADQDPSDEPASVLLGRIKAERDSAATSTKTVKRGRLKARSA